jgi:hypothetical protein
METIEPSNGEYESPMVTIEYNEQTVVLHFFNTRLRVFTDEQYNHTEFYDNRNKLCATASRQLMDLLFDMDYPMLSLPYVDKNTMDWFVSQQTGDLETMTPDMFE